MRVCDRHPDRPAKESIHIERDDARFDLCPECKTDLLAFLCATRSSETALPFQEEVRRKATEIAQGRRKHKENSAPAE